MNYLPAGTDFTDMDKKKPHCKDQEACPKCKGYGGWNLQLNAYGQGKHFRMFCCQCWGHGYVDKDSKDATCIHDFHEISAEEARNKGVHHFGRCYHVSECSKCGKLISYDSSD